MSCADGFRKSKWHACFPFPIGRLAQPPQKLAMASHQLDAIESEEPDRPLLASPSNNLALGPTVGELAIEDARKLTRDNPAAVANIVKGWINGEAPA